MPSTVFNKEQVTIVKGFLEDFRDAPKRQKRNVVKEATTAVIASMPKLDKKRTKEVRKSVKTWMYNNGRSRQDKKLTRARKFTFRHVVAYKHKEELEDKVRTLSGSAPGTTEYIAKYQAGLKNLCDEMSDEDIEEYRMTAKEWNEQAPPEEVQRASAEKYGRKYVKDFATAMRRELGMKVLVMTAHVDTKGTISYSAHEFEDDKDKRTFTDAYPNWDSEEGFMRHWTRYSESYFGEGRSDDNSADEKPAKKRKEPVKIKLDRDGRPVLPKVDAESLPTLQRRKDFIRAFLTAHYSERNIDETGNWWADFIKFIGFDTGNPKATVPWVAINEDPETYIQSKYLPVDVSIGDPSKMVQQNVESILNHWRDRQAAKKIPFRFFHFLARDLLLPGHAKGLTKSSNASQAAGPSKPKTKPKPKHRKVVTDETDETDDTDATDDTDDADDTDDSDDTDNISVKLASQTAGPSKPKPKRKHPIVIFDADDANETLRKKEKRKAKDDDEYAGESSSSDDLEGEHDFSMVGGPQGTASVGDRETHRVTAQNNIAGPSNHNRAPKQGTATDGDEGTNQAPRRGAVTVRDGQTDRATASNGDRAGKHTAAPKPMKSFLDPGFVKPTGVAPVMANNKFDFLRTLCTTPWWISFINTLEKYQAFGSTDLALLPIPGQPEWLSWEYDEYSMPYAYDCSPEWFETVDWIVQGNHLSNGSHQSLGYIAITDWALGSGLMYRDMLHMFAMRKEYADAADCMEVWRDGRSAYWKMMVQRTEKILNRDFGGLQIEEEEQNGEVEVRAPRLSPVLMTEQELLDGIITPLLEDNPPKTAPSQIAYLRRISVVPDLQKLHQVLSRCKPQSESEKPVWMKNKPRWLIWSYGYASVPAAEVFSNMDKWHHCIDWFLSAPHLNEDRTLPRSYQSVELWMLGMGMIIQDLIRFYKERRDPNLKGSSELSALWDWITVQDPKAKTLLAQTGRALENRYLAGTQGNVEENNAPNLIPPQIPDEPTGDDEASDLEDNNAPNPIPPQIRNEPTSHAEASPTKGGNVTGSVTRSMARRATQDQGKGGKKRKRDYNEDLPVIAEADEKPVKKTRRR